MQTGQINVQTENIFPIIKKFLYSDTEIFVRELVSNAVDATQKIKTLSSLGEYKGDLGIKLRFLERKNLLKNTKIKRRQSLVILDWGFILPLWFPTR